MKKFQLTSRLCLTVAAFAAATSALAMSNADFDRAMAAQLGAAQQQNANSMMAIRQQHLQQNYGRLVGGYRQYLAAGQRAMSFEQFVSGALMPAPASNGQGALDAQNRQFQGN